MLMVVILAPETGRAQQGTATASSSRIHVGGYVSYVPWLVATEGASVRLTSEADRSPLPSLVQYTSENRSRTFGLGLVVSSRAPIDPPIQPQLGLGVIFSENMRMLEGSLGGAFVLESDISVSAGLQVLLGYLWGELGHVGSTSGDIYLIAPDGERYEAGSTIDVSGFRVGAEPMVGLQFGDDVQVRVEGGYRLMAAVGDWSYHVIDGTDMSRRSELPASGFRANPPDLGLNGWFMRAVLLFKLTP